MRKLTVRTIGRSLGVTLPAQAVRALRVRAGDTLYFTQAPGGFRLTPHEPDLAKTMEVGGSFMKRCRNALRNLAG